MMPSGSTLRQAFAAIRATVRRVLAVLGSEELVKMPPCRGRVVRGDAPTPHVYR